MQRIGFFGTQSVGKTTLLNALRSEPAFADATFFTGLTRRLEQQGYKIKEAGDDDTQLQIARLHMERIILSDNFVTDRTILDCLAYTIYLYRRNKVKKETVEKIYAYTNFILPHYTHLFYVPIEFDNVEDGLRSVDPEFRKEIDDIMNKDMVVDGLITVRHTIHRISGSVVQRTNRVYEIVKGF